MGGEEKRSHPRTDVDLPAQVTTPSGASVSCQVENLGRLGALLSTPEFEGALAVGDRVRVVIDRGAAGSVEARGKVLRVDQEFFAGDIRRSMAVRFDEELDFDF